ncbi:MAG: AI-2E family transporter [Xylophilus sp.]|nr:AI-2E family transporter [Xylophilus sp.]MBP6616611.1 AI-2E family transporter [Burkholderiaceae bacterium]MBP7419882.1 AI-2E family transporter [Burkholderiaceae bacterium]MBP8150664.1 AI-2E family transporter [Xylophilus sp.]MBP8229248.1 AI-2E family transporter [Xylophilus sp.]
MNERFWSFVHGVFLALIIGWVLHIGQDIFIPIIFSVLVGFVIIGMTRMLAKVPVLGPRLSIQVRYIVAALIMAVGLVSVVWLLFANVGRAVALAPQYQDSLLNSIQNLAVTLGLESEPSWKSLRQQFLAQVSIQRLVGGTLGSVLSIVATLIVVFLYVAFLLVEQRSFAAKIKNISDDPGQVAFIRQMITNVNGKIGTYLALKTLLSVVLGILSWAIMAFFGMEFAVFWGVLIALLNYVPYIGSFLSVFLPAVFAILQFGNLNSVLAVMVPLSIVQFANGNFLDPYLMGNSLNLSPFVILVSLTVWSALWGIPGAFLAVPMTAVMVMIFAEFPGTRPFAVLLSRKGDV